MVRDHDEDPGNITVPEGRVLSKFPMRDFVEQGLLHVANEAWFWPRGLMLTASRINAQPTLEALVRTILEPVLRRPVTPDDMRIALAAAKLEDWYREGLVVQEFRPPESIHTGLVEDEHAAIHARFEAWDAGRAENLT